MAHLIFKEHLRQRKEMIFVPHCSFRWGSLTAEWNIVMKFARREVLLGKFAVSGGSWELPCRDQFSRLVSSEMRTSIHSRPHSYTRDKSITRQQQSTFRPTELHESMSLPEERNSVYITEQAFNRSLKSTGQRLYCVCKRIRIRI